MTAFIFFILIIWVAVSLAKKSGDSEKEDKFQNFKYELLQEIHKLKNRIIALEQEIKILKGEVVEQELISTPVAQENIVEEPIVEASEVIVVEETEEVSTMETLYLQNEKEPSFEEIQRQALEKIDFSENVLSANNEVDFIEKKVEEKDTDIESFVAGNILNRVGALALIIGMGFFLKYAFDQNWISPLIQILFGFGVSIGLLCGANHFHKKEENFKVFSQGLSGAGIAISYLSTFAAYEFYHLIPTCVAYVLMLTSTIVSFRQALKQDSRVVALLGLTGGFLTPFVLYSSGIELSGILVYLLFLNSWIIALLNKKSEWRIVELLSILSTYFIYFTHSKGYFDNLLGIGLLLSLNWLLFFGLNLSKAVKNQSLSTRENIINGILFSTGIYYLIKLTSNGLASASLMFIAIIYLIVGILVYKKYNQNESFLKQNILASIILIVLSTNTAYTGFVKTILWSIEAFVILWLGVKYEKDYVYKSAATLFSFAMMSLLFNSQTYSYYLTSSYIPILNLRSLTFAVIVGLLAYSPVVLAKRENTYGIQQLLRTYWCTLLFVWLSVEISDVMALLARNESNLNSQFIEFNKTMIQVVVWISYAIRLLKSGVEKNQKVFLTFGFLGIFWSLWALILTGLTVQPLEKFIPIFNMRFLAFSVSSIFLFNMAKFIEQHKDKYEWAETVQTIFTYCWFGLIFIMLGVEIGQFMDKLALAKDGVATTFLVFNKSMIQVIVWSVYSAIIAKSAITKNKQSLINCSFFALFFTLIQLLVVGLNYVPVEKFIPIANLRFLAFVLVAGVMIYVSKLLKQHRDKYEWAGTVQTVLSYSWCILLFLLINSEIGSYFAKKSFEVVANNSQVMDFVKSVFSGLAWILFSIPLLRNGLKTKNKPFVIVGGIIFALALLLSVFKANTYYPSDGFMLIFNPRMLLFVLLTVSLFLTKKWIKENKIEHPIALKVVKGIPILLSFFILFVLTVETKDFFGSAYNLAISGSNAVNSIQQLSYSGVWLIYSIVLMVAGIVKKNKPVRYISLYLLCFVVLKIFIFDLSFLEQLYRIISFMGLGVIMLLSSYFYQKYSKQIKSLITEEEPQNINL